jgi:hypothetical protein
MAIGVNKTQKRRQKTAIARRGRDIGEALF